MVLAQLINLNSGFNIAFNKLTGTIPSELALMTSLTHTFSLKANELTGTIPLELSTLSLITDTFDLSVNLLTGCIPDGIRAMDGGDFEFGHHTGQVANNFRVRIFETLRLKRHYLHDLYCSDHFFFS